MKPHIRRVNGQWRCFDVQDPYCWFVADRPCEALRLWLLYCVGNK